MRAEATQAPLPSRRGGRIACSVLLVCSALTAAVAVVFFVIGLADGSVSSFNAGLWLGLLAVVAGSLWGGYRLRAQGRFGRASAVLAITAVPGLAGVLFVLVLLITQPRWN